MAFTQADLDALNTAIVGQELEVDYDGRRVRFRSVAELRAAYEHVKQEIAAATVKTVNPRTTFSYNFVTQRGE
jgi:hypothetical protein